MKLGGSGSFKVSGGVVGRLGFRVGVSASYIVISAVSVILISCTRPPCPYSLRILK